MAGDRRLLVPYLRIPALAVLFQKAFVEASFKWCARWARFCGVFGGKRALPKECALEVAGFYFSTCLIFLV